MFVRINDFDDKNFDFLWSGSLQTISGMFENDGVFDVQSMIVMSENSSFLGLEASRPHRGCLEMKGFSILDR